MALLAHKFSHAGAGVAPRPAIYVSIMYPRHTSASIPFGIGCPSALVAKGNLNERSIGQAADKDA